MPVHDNTEQLENLSDIDLDRLEDRLLTERELDWTMRSGATAGRIAVLALFTILFLILKGLAERFAVGGDGGALLFIALYLLLLATAVVGAWAIWTGIGRHGRRFLRHALHYWPVTLYLVALLAGAYSR